MSDMQLKGSTGFFGKETPINVRKVNEGVSTEKVKAALQDNNLDEVVVKGQSGASYVVYADELSMAKGSLPKPGTKVSLPLIPGEDGKNPLTVQLVDDESNEDYSGLAAGLVGMWMNKNGGVNGDDAKIKGISEAVKLCNPTTKGVTDPEIHWALQLEDKVKNEDYKPNEQEIDMYAKIARKLSEK
ncbi:MAG: hypothetical protein AB7I41_16930 [Candidatus Sericytochromatia bacterium]